MFNRRLQIQNQFVFCVSTLCAVLVLAIFILIFSDILSKGLGVINWNFVIMEPEKAGRSGGIFPIIMASLMILGLCLSFAVPLSLATALFLVEYCSTRSWFYQWAATLLNILSGVPSIVFGLFGNVLFCQYLGLGFSILSGSLTLTCMVLPLMTRSIMIGLRSIPNTYRLQSETLALKKNTLTMRIIFPLLLPSLLLGVVLSSARALAESAALIFTSGYVDRMPKSIFDSGRSLAVHIFDLSFNVPGGDSMAYGSSLVLVALLALINIVCGYFSEYWRKRSRI